jgi:L-alanine-DL-glutamate epimerase-like enolase superfamily enzyme
MKGLALGVRIERVPMKAPLRITGYTFSDAETVVVELHGDGCTGLGEASGIYYHGETPASMAAQIEAVRGMIEAGITREQLQHLLPAGGARNALDCALWALESHCSGQPIWQLAGLSAPLPVLSTHTIGAGTPDEIAAAAAACAGMPRIKLKLLGDGQDADRVHAVRRALPEAWLMVDANQGLARGGYLALLPAFQAAQVSLIEQPFPVGKESWMDGLPRPIPVAADESCLTRVDLSGLVGRFDVASIKLDKSGGFTEALGIARQARGLGLGLMVGCMVTGSLGMAPAFLVGQLCDVCDIDGPLYITQDRRPGLQYGNGVVTMPAGVWGI